MSFSTNTINYDHYHNDESATNMEITTKSSDSSAAQNVTNNNTSTTARQSHHHHHPIGDVVMTPFGKGTIRHYRPQDHVYVIELLMSHHHQHNTNSTTTTTTTTMTMVLYTKMPPPPPAFDCSSPTPKPDSTKQTSSSTSSMQLNDAYEALEQMRRYNLEMECFENGIEYCDHEKCTVCLLNSKSNDTRGANNNMLAGLQRLVGPTNKSSNNNSNKKKSFLLRRSASPCLICASPTCSRHASRPFQKERITLCLDCEKLFDISFITDCMNNNKRQERMLDKLMDTYDRCVLLLQYSSQFMDGLITSLEQSKETHNRVNLGSSSAGVVSGVLGVAAAATILTPAGAPLLIASLLFGGSATAVQTSSDAMQHYSEPSRLADRIIALMGVTQSILRVTSVLRDALMRDYVRKDVYVNDNNKTEIVKESAPSISDSSHEPIAQGVLAASNIGQGISLGGSVTMEMAEVGARSATALSRAGTAAARALRFARIAGGALSAAVLVLEANSMHSTISEIRAGSPCHKAETLRKIQEELDQLPSTASLESECQSYMQALTERPAVKNANKAVHESTGTLIVEGADDTGETDFKAKPGKQLSSSSPSPQSSPRLRSSSDASGLSLLDRIRIHKLREAEDAKHDVNGRAMSGDDLPLDLCI